MFVLSCKIDAAPCPLDMQDWINLDFVSYLAFFDITPVIILKVLSWGFGVVLLGFLLGYVVGVSLSLVRRI